MTQEIKAQIKIIMMDHLKSVGWPDCQHPDEVVMSNLQVMFDKLLKAELVKYADYDQYLLAANLQYHIRK